MALIYNYSAIDTDKKSFSMRSFFIYRLIPD